MRDVLFSMQYIIGDSGKRTAPLLAYCDKNEIFRVIQESLSESGNDLAKLTPTDFMPACFDVCRHVDIFGAWQVYLVDSQDLSKLVYSPDSGNNVKIVELATGEFDAIASSIYTELDNLLDACQ